MGFRCVNCGGNIVFDIDSQSMKCQHCGSMISPDQFEVRNSSTGEDISESELTLFTCGSCGAQLHGTEESQVGFCPYCGGQSLLQSKKRRQIHAGEDHPLSGFKGTLLVPFC